MYDIIKAPSFGVVRREEHMTIIQKQAELYRLGLLPLGGVDGIWGEASRTATAAMQRSLGLEPDGVWGNQTDAAVRKALGMDTETTGTWWDDIEFFTQDEFRCQCGGRHCDGFPVEPQEAMVRACDEIRRRLGVPVQIVDAGGSGVRCARHNAAVGGVANSLHLSGNAADLHSSASPEQMYAVADDVIGQRGEVGIYSWGVHVGIGKYSRWKG